MNWAVIMAGGSGTRFWPESRAGRPKQFLSLAGKKTLFEQTLERIRPVVGSSEWLVVTTRDHAPQARKLSGLKPSQILAEPVGRNTAPCAILAADFLMRRDPETVLAILPSDHLIRKPKVFQKALRLAFDAARETRLPVTFGVRPVSAHTGYGYLESGALYQKSRGFEIRRLKRFHEKPDPAKARAFLASGRFYWNSGIFVWRAADLLGAARKYMPGAWRISRTMWKGNFAANMRRRYPAMPAISIDYGLMEKLPSILTIPVDMDWHDLGGWHAMKTLWDKDRDGNAVRGNVLLVESKDNIVKGDGNRLIALLGAKDLVVVDTPGALLICAKTQSESIRKIVSELKDRKEHRYL